MTEAVIMILRGFLGCVLGNKDDFGGKLINTVTYNQWEISSHVWKCEQLDIICTKLECPSFKMTWFMLQLDEFEK